MQSKRRKKGRGKGKVNSDEIGDFSSFIEVIEPLDIPIIDNLYTWLNSSGRSKSRRDRFLISEVLSKEWGVMVQHVGNHNISDHRPIWL